MQFENISKDLLAIINSSVKPENKAWFDKKSAKIVAENSKRDLYLTYSMIAVKIPPNPLSFDQVSDSPLTKYLTLHETNAQQLVRVYLFVQVLEADNDFFSPLVANIVQVADTSELVTFLKYLILLPNAGYYQNTAVDTLRTNIETVFDAITLKNPYPSLYFNTQQWNQMYLKAAFLQRDLRQIVNVEKMGNKELAKIISDYAHERWKASRTIDPNFWRPVSKFIDEVLLKDMERLFKSANNAENYAAALCCYESNNPKAKQLLEEDYPELVKKIENNYIKWETITN